MADPSDNVDGLYIDDVAFVQDCVHRGNVLWTYHVNMRLEGRFIARESILAAVDTYDRPDPNEWEEDLKNRRLSQ